MRRHITDQHAGTVSHLQQLKVRFGGHGTILVTQVGNVSDYLCNKLELESELVRTVGRKQKRAPGCLHLITHRHRLTPFVLPGGIFQNFNRLEEKLHLTAKFPAKFAMIKTKCLQVISIFLGYFSEKEIDTSYCREERISELCEKYFHFILQ